MRAVLFDFGGTLDYPRHWLDRFLTHYRAAGVEITRAELDPAFDAATRMAYRSSATVRNFGLAELIPYLVNLHIEFLCDPEAGRMPRVAHALGDRAATLELTRRVSDAFIQESIAGLARSRAVLAVLAARLKVGVVSNFYGNLERILRDAGMAEWLSAIADSGQLRLFKPDLALYRAALAMLDATAAETIMVGDSLDKDCAPAHRLGMRTVWLRHQDAPSVGPDELRDADFTIATLEEFEELSCRIV